MLTNWVSKIDRIKKAYLDEFSSLDSESLNWKPDARSWSIAQCIDHIIVTNEQYFRIIEKINKGVYESHWMAFIPFLPKMFGSVILKSVKPETIHKKNKTFKVFEPSESYLDGDIMSRFEANQIKLKAYLNEINPRNYKKIISSPVNGAIVYPLVVAVEIIIAHEERHFLQAKNVKALLKNVAENP